MVPPILGSPHESLFKVAQFARRERTLSVWVLDALRQERCRVLRDPRFTQRVSSSLSTAAMMGLSRHWSAAT